MSQSRKGEILVIGAGASGITSALAFQIEGYNVKIVTKELPFNTIQKSDFSSHYPAASIIPHSVNFPDILDLFTESAAIFEALYQQEFTGIEKHKHFELFSDKQDLPNYSICYPSFGLFAPFKDSSRPSHPTLESSFGWSFDCLFTDWGQYYPKLFELFKKLGGEIIQGKINSETLLDLDTEIIINCAEIYGATLLGEDFSPQIYRGHLLHIPGMPMLKNTEGQKVSYNFTPDKSIYSTELGAEQDVYFYQRENRWIFGGSRQKGTIDINGKWIGENVIDPSIQVGNILFPEQILKLNLDIINHTFDKYNITLDNIIPKIGYRFMGNSEERLRIDETEIGDKLIINNFGHGGSGVTLSWGCALRCLNLLNKGLGVEAVDHVKFREKLLSVI